MNKGFKSKLKVLIPLFLVAVVVVVAVKVFRPQPLFDYAGTIEATKSDLPSRINSVVKLKHVAEGQLVKKGEPLFSLSDEEFKIAADSASRDFARSERLFKLGSLPQEIYEHQKSKKDETGLRLQWCSIVAPIDGVVLSTYREVGEWVSPGVKMLTIANLDEVWAILYVESGKIAELKLRQAVRGVLSEVKGRIFEGLITHIGSEAEFTPKNVQTRQERARLVFAVKVSFKNPDHQLKPGMTIEVKL